MNGVMNGLCSSQAARAVLQAFLSEGADGERVVMVADPPFGGLVKPLANSFSCISKTWQSLQTMVEQAGQPEENAQHLT